LDCSFSSRMVDFSSERGQMYLQAQACNIVTAIVGRPCGMMNPPRHHYPLPKTNSQRPLKLSTKQQCKLSQVNAMGTQFVLVFVLPAADGPKHGTDQLYLVKSQLPLPSPVAPVAGVLQREAAPRVQCIPGEQRRAAEVQACRCAWMCC
jgi:hypothetical protein